MNNKIILNARYGLKHEVEKIDENTFRTKEFSRFSFTGKDENGKYYGVSYIDFDGGPFIHEGCKTPWDDKKIVKGFHLEQKDDDTIPWVDILTEDFNENESDSNVKNI